MPFRSDATLECTAVREGVPFTSHAFHHCFRLVWSRRRALRAAQAAKKAAEEAKKQEKAEDKSDDASQDADKSPESPTV